MFVLLIFILFQCTEISANCKINISKDLPQKTQPVYLHDDNRGFIYPQYGSDTIEIESNGYLLISCPGQKIVNDELKTLKDAPFNNVSVKCLPDGTFNIEDIIFNTLKDIKCTGNSQTTEIQSGIECGLYGFNGSIGYNISTQDGLYKYYPLIDFCREKQTLHTVFVHLKVLARHKRKHCNASQHQSKFRQGALFTRQNMSQIYKIKCVFRRIKMIVGNSNIVNKYIENKIKGARYLLETGHLAAKADVIYPTHKYATFNYANAVPMWKTINRGNWVKVENAIREYANKNKRDLDVWTGSIGVLQLKDKDGILQNIYLKRDKKFKNQSVPVPKLLFKVVYDEGYQAGIVFVTINNPHIEIIEDEYIICKNICDQVLWIKNDKKSSFNNSFIRGYTYCCEYSDFQKSFPYLPISEIRNIMVNDFFNLDYF